MNVATRMSYPVHTALKETSVADVVRTMTEHRVSSIPVVDEKERFVGIVTVADLVPQTRNAPASNVQLMSLQNEYVDFASLPDAYAKVGELSASSVMHESVTIGPDAEVVTAAQIMAEHKVGALPVVGEDGVLVGIFTRSDLARMAMEQGVE